MTVHTISSKGEYQTDI